MNSRLSTGQKLQLNLYLHLMQRKSELNNLNRLELDLLHTLEPLVNKFSNPATRKVYYL